MNKAEPVIRTREIEEFTNLHFIHPVSIRLSRLLARIGVSPNTVSFAGMLCGILAGIAYYHYQQVIYTVAGFSLMITWHILDGTDGQLARLTNSQSESGKIIDGICDYVTYIAVYLGLGFALQRQYGDVIWGVVLLSGICHAVQSATYEVQRQEYNFWGHANASARLPRLSELEHMDVRGSFSRKLMNYLYVLYVRMQYMGSRISSRQYEDLVTKLKRDDEQAQLIRRHYREVFAPSVRAWSVLSANYRTVGIFVCALLKFPSLYFITEIVILTLVSVILVTKQMTRYEDFLRSLAALDSE